MKKYQTPNKLRKKLVIQCLNEVKYCLSNSLLIAWFGLGNRLLLVIFISLFFPACLRPDFDCAELKQSISTNFNLIDSLCDSERNSTIDLGAFDKQIDSLNNELLKNLSTLTVQDRFQSCDLNARGNFSYQLSSDKKLSIISWNTRQGGTMIDYTTSVIFKTNQGTFLKTLKYGETGYEDNSKILFDTVFTLINKNGQPIYLAYGYGQFSSSLHFRVIKGFMIQNDLIEQFNLFPDHSSELWVQYDYQHWRPNDKILDVQFLKNGTLLKIPILDDLDRPTGKYSNLTFDGSTYKQQ